MTPLAKYQDPVPCESCSKEAVRIISGMPGLIFPGDSWISKNLRIERQMRSKNERLDKKMREQKGDQASKYTLAPNVGGEVVKDWSDAQKLAKDQGKDTSSYEPMIQREKIQKTKGVV